MTTLKRGRIDIRSDLFLCSAGVNYSSCEGTRMQNLVPVSCRLSCFSQASDKIVLWLTDSEMMAVNPHTFIIQVLIGSAMQRIRCCSCFGRHHFAITESTKCRPMLIVLLFKAKQSHLNYFYRFAKNRKVTRCGQCSWHLLRSFFALSFGLFAKSKFSAAIKFGLLYRIYLLIGFV